MFSSLFSDLFYLILVLVSIFTCFFVYYSFFSSEAGRTAEEEEKLLLQQIGKGYTISYKPAEGSEAIDESIHIPSKEMFLSVSQVETK